MPDEIAESAKAVQEVAKTTGQAIKTIEKFGQFFARVMGESIEASCGMLADTLKLKRWERQIRLIEKIDNALNEKKIAGKTRIVSPKLALAIFREASFEEDNSLHDIWANLFVSALDPGKKQPRTAFVNIIKQLEPVDVKILNQVHENYTGRFEGLKRKRRIANKRYPKPRKSLEHVPPTIFSISQPAVIDKLKIPIDFYRTAIDNLMRLRLISSYIEDRNIEIEDVYHDVSYDHGYLEVAITSLGIDFVEACTRKE